jgi:hypothetical protein
LRATISRLKLFKGIPTAPDKIGMLWTGCHWRKFFSYLVFRSTSFLRALVQTPFFLKVFAPTPLLLEALVQTPLKIRAFEPTPLKIRVFVPRKFLLSISYIYYSSMYIIDTLRNKGVGANTLPVCSNARRGAAINLLIRKVLRVTLRPDPLQVQRSVPSVPSSMTYARQILVWTKYRISHLVTKSPDIFFLQKSLSSST